MAQVRGITENARAMLVSSAISASILFMTPIFPFSAPAKNRLYSVESEKYLNEKLEEASSPQGQCPK